MLTFASQTGPKLFTPLSNYCSSHRMSPRHVTNVCFRSFLDDSESAKLIPRVNLFSRSSDQFPRELQPLSSTNCAHKEQLVPRQLCYWSVLFVNIDENFILSAILRTTEGTPHQPAHPTADLLNWSSLSETTVSQSSQPSLTHHTSHLRHQTLLSPQPINLVLPLPATQLSHPTNDQDLQRPSQSPHPKEPVCLARS